ncbi:MAG: response regulator [Pseudomonadales bacterium]|nr:response regulator [Pseudomonadales bacterium]
MTTKAVSLRSLLILAILIPTGLLVFSESRFLFTTYQKSVQANSDVVTNELIAKSRAIEQLLNELMFTNLEAEFGEDEDKLGSFASMVFNIVQEQSEFIRLVTAKNSIDSKLLEELTNQMLELTERHKDLVEGITLDRLAWIEIIEEVKQAFQGIRMALLIPEDAQDLNLFLQFTLRSYIQELERTTVEEAFLLNQAILNHTFDDETAASLVAIRKISDIKRNELKLIASQLKMLELINESSLLSLQDAMSRVERSLVKFDDIRRGIYVSALMGGQEVDKEAWQYALKDFLIQLKYAEENATKPINFALNRNRENTQQALLRLILAIIVSMILLVIIFGSVRVRILVPIRSITDRMIKLSKGDINVRLPEAKHDDEIGSMLEAISIFKSNALFIEEQRKELEVSKEKAQASEKLKSEFLASMSHEIRTPMNGVLGMLGLLNKTTLNQQQGHYVDTATSSARSLLALINDILDFSKIEAGRLQLEIIDFNARKMIEETVTALALPAAEKKVELVIDATDLVDPYVRGDPSRIRQVLTNLLSNAIKFTESGEIIVKCSLTSNVNNERRFECVVQDSGIGIPESKLETLFDSFTQVDASTTRKYGGSGLGLAIVKNLCLLMGGDVTVSSEEGKGSRFTFSVALRPGQQQSFIQPEIDLQDKEVLIVDDNQTNREVLNGQLVLWGAKVTQAMSGLQALEILKAKAPNQFDVLILDMQMPEMDGATLGSTISQDSRFNQAKRIMMTSVTHHGDAHFYAEHGFDAYFSKPVVSSDLQKALSVVLDDGEILKQAKPLLTQAHIEQLQPAARMPDKRVLLVEDNKVNQVVALGIVEDLGIVVDVAENGLEALVCLQKEVQAYDLILMDCQMPEMDGYEATRQIRAGNRLARYRDIPIIAMTANAMKGDKEKCLEAGMNDYVPKPVDVDELEEKLSFWLKRPGTAAEVSCIEPANDEDHKLEDNDCWDRERALKRVRGKEERLDVLLSMYAEKAERQLEEIKRLLESSDMEGLASLAHAIKGSTANLGAIDVYEDSAAVEMAARQNDPEAAAENVDKLNASTYHFLSLVSHYLDK